MFVFFFNDTATTEIYTLSLHDALPIYHRLAERLLQQGREHEGEHQRRELVVELAEEPAEHAGAQHDPQVEGVAVRDRKSTRLNSSHANISYAVFCLKKKKNNHQPLPHE